MLPAHPRPPTPQEHCHHCCLLRTSRGAAGDHLPDGEQARPMLSASEQLPQTLGCCPGRASQPEALEQAQVLEFQSQLCLTSWVALSKSLNLPEPLSVHLPNGGQHANSDGTSPRLLGLYETEVVRKSVSVSLPSSLCRGARTSVMVMPREFSATPNEEGSDCAGGGACWCRVHACAGRGGTPHHLENGTGGGTGCGLSQAS